MSRKIVDVCERLPRKKTKDVWKDLALDLAIIAIITACFVLVIKKIMSL